MIIAEVKKDDKSEWETRLFNCSVEAFYSMASKRFVDIGRIDSVPFEVIIGALRRSLGWDK